MKQDTISAADVPSHQKPTPPSKTCVYASNTIDLFDGVAELSKCLCAPPSMTTPTAAPPKAEQFWIYGDLVIGIAGSSLK